MQNKAIIVCGTTASGKSDYAIDYASKNNGELINIDSLQVYKDLHIITACPSDEDLKKVPHHLFKIFDGNTHCSVAKYVELARITADEISSRGKLPVFVGGTGFYINSIINGINDIPEIDEKIRAQVEQLSKEEIIKELEKNTPDVLEKINKNDRQRLQRAYEYFLQTGSSFLSAKNLPKKLALPYNFEIHYVYRNSEEIKKRISDRMYKMLDCGVEEEIKEFLQKGFAKNSTIYKADGVIQFEKYFSGLISKERAILDTIKKVEHYAKRQRTWYNNQLPPEITKKIELKD